MRMNMLKLLPILAATNVAYIRGSPHRRKKADWGAEACKTVFAAVARRKGSSDDYIMQAFQNYIDKLGLAKAELKCDPEQSTLDVRTAMHKKNLNTILVPSQSPKGSKGSLGAGERANLTQQGHVRALRLATAKNRSQRSSCKNCLSRN